jgi:hypothetical protein
MYDLFSLSSAGTVKGFLNCLWATGVGLGRFESPQSLGVPRCTQKQCWLRKLRSAKSDIIKTTIRHPQHCLLCTASRPACKKIQLVRLLLSLSLLIFFNQSRVSNALGAYEWSVYLTAIPTLRTLSFNRLDGTGSIHPMRNC